MKPFDPTDKSIVSAALEEFDSPKPQKTGPESGKPWMPLPDFGVVTARSEFTFAAWYEDADHWFDSEDDVLDKLAGWYSGYFTYDKQIDFGKLKQGLIAGEHKARELFKNLFAMPKRLSYHIDFVSHLEPFCDTYGAYIIAHGVEQPKGGLRNLLMMAVADKVDIPSVSWGCFQLGQPNISPVGHGPYYVVSAISADDESRHPNRPTIAEIAYIVVPFPEVRDMLFEQLDRVVEHGLLSQGQASEFKAKVKSYDEFEAICKADPSLRKKRQSSKSSSKIAGPFPLQSPIRKRTERSPLAELDFEPLDVPKSLEFPDFDVPPSATKKPAKSPVKRSVRRKIDRKGGIPLPLFPDYDSSLPPSKSDEARIDKSVLQLSPLARCSIFGSPLPPLDFSGDVTPLPPLEFEDKENLGFGSENTPPRSGAPRKPLGLRAGGKSSAKKELTY